MPVNNADLNELLNKAIDAGKPIPPWYKRWWNKLIYNLKIGFRILILVIVTYSLGCFISEHPVLFMAMVAALG